MLQQIFEFLLHSGWKDIAGNTLQKSKQYDANTHMVITYWETPNYVVTLDDVSEINLDFEERTFKIWTKE